MRLQYGGVGFGGQEIDRHLITPPEGNIAMLHYKNAFAADCGRVIWLNRLQGCSTHLFHRQALQTGIEDAIMDPEQVQATAARDQLWASLRQLKPQIDRLAQGEFDGSERERQIAQLLARIVSAELRFRADDADQGNASGVE